LKEKRGLLVASTDLSHFHAEEAANILDTTMLDAVASFSTDEVILAYRSGKGQACGVMAVLAVMVAAKELGADRAQVLHYSTSGEISGDFGSVVGYGAVVFLRD
jgi:AmmeMemoRadiSam system protein B